MFDAPLAYFAQFIAHLHNEGLLMFSALIFFPRSFVLPVVW